MSTTNPPLPEFDIDPRAFRHLADALIAAYQGIALLTNTFRDPATNVSIHVPNESDDPTWTRDAAGERPERARGRANTLATGNSTKYSPIAQERAKKSGFAVPEDVPDYTRKVAASGAIHPRE